MSAAVDEATIARLIEQGDQPEPMFTLDPNEAKVCRTCGTVFHRDKRRGRADFRTMRHHCSTACAQGARTQARTEIPLQPCTQCGNNIPNTTNQRPGKYRLRKYCSTACSSAARRGVATAVAANEPRTCENCGGQFTRPTSLSVSRFRTRRACGTDCAKVLASRTRTVHTAPKTCPCGTTFERPYGLPRAEWAKRNCCSRACGARYRDRPDQGPTSKPCEKCGGPVLRTTRGRVDFERRRFCSKRCGGASRRKPPKPRPVRAPKPVVVETKPCAGCPEVITRKPRGEAPSAWARRKYHSHACSDAARRKPAAERAPRKPRSTQPKPAPPAVAIPPKPPVAARPVWRPGLAEDGSGELAPGFTLEVNPWAGVRRG